jgi:beta-galactosidase
MEDPANVRLDCLISLVAGARAYQNPRWRPLLDGPLFGAYGWYGMDGSRTPRSAEMVNIIRWAGEAGRRGLWRSKPVTGPVAILILEESQANCYARHGTTDFYSACVKGAWQAFRDAGIQCDFVKPGRIGDHGLVYAPYPVALDDATLRGLAGWVRAGGNLVSEVCFGYFNEYGHACPRWHDRGIGELFGCGEKDTVFAPDREETWTIVSGRQTLLASLYRQSYVPNTGTVMGRHPGGEPAMVRNRYGRGCATIIGGMPGYAYAVRPTTGSRDWFAGLTDAPGRRPPVSISPAVVVPRVWTGTGGKFLWLVNTGAADARAVVAPAPESGGFRRAEPVRHGRDARISRGRLAVRVPGRDAVILKLS